MEKFILAIYGSAFFFYLLGWAKSRFFSQVGRSFLFLGFWGNVYLMLRHFLENQRLPLVNTSETLLFAVTIVVFIFLILGRKRSLSRLMGLGVSLISFLGFLFFLVLKGPAAPLLPALQSPLLVFHVLSCILAYSFFTVSFIAGLIYWLKKNLDPQAAISLGRLGHRCICLGFFLLTLGIVLGSLWAQYAWGHWWGWDPKETWALLTWFIYADYLYGCLYRARGLKRLFAVAILGFSSCLFTYLGVNFLLKGLHSYG